MRICWKNMIRLEKSLKTFILLFLLCVAFWLIHDVTHCDQVTKYKLVKTPEGKFIPRYKDVNSEVPFGKLMKHCRYDAKDKIDCPDVRYLGEYVNRRSNLAIARILAIFELICKKYNIQYFLLFGTLLGAVRDGVMIPWDSDADVGMMLDDYQKLLKYIRLELPEDLYFQDGSDNNRFYRNNIAKIRDKNSCYGHCLRSGCEWHDGLQMDIFVFKQSKNNIQNMFNRGTFAMDDVFPTKRITLEGLSFPAPKHVDKLLTLEYGENFMIKPKKTNQCGKHGYIAIPWYSCKYISSLPLERKNKILKDSMDHSNSYFWYFG